MMQSILRYRLERSLEAVTNSIVEALDKHQAVYNFTPEEVDELQARLESKMIDTVTGYVLERHVEQEKAARGLSGPPFPL